MATFEEIELIRCTPAAVEFATDWLRERKGQTGTSDRLMNLTAWSSTHPHHALGIVLNLIERADADEEASEMIAMGPVTEIVEFSGGEFAPLLRQAISTYPKFALYTAAMRKQSQKPCWVRLRDDGKNG